MPLWKRTLKAHISSKFALISINQKKQVYKSYYECSNISASIKLIWT